MGMRPGHNVRTETFWQNGVLMSSTLTLFVCRECDGAGTVVELNAYDETYRVELPCSCCGGTGFVTTNVEVPIISPGPDETRGEN